MRCSACGTENPGNRKFCGGCGAALARSCGACGAANEPRFAFCGECGSPLSDPGAPGEVAESGSVTSDSVAAGAATRPKVAERRLVSVLFADLVGFTALSESKDAEDVRELLSKYFDVCRELITRYGGIVEKFIGDAVMAVWGTPVANEDDAERAVRAAIELVDAVRSLGEDMGLHDFAARAGVLSGEAAVNLGVADASGLVLPNGQGMVAGDLVNSASRVQAAADPGTVLVGEATRRATEAAIAYADAGVHALKGKSEPVQLWRALRVVAGRGGANRSAGLEAPFVGRDRELRVVKELFHASAEQGSAHLLSVTGTAGIGKSRLGWEFFKYVDGLTGTVWWHRGRCLSYGEGVTYWALAEMVRARAGIVEEEPADSALAKLRDTVRQIVDDEDERAWVEPRLANLLGLGDHASSDAADLFSGWRLFLERMAARNPVVLLFEDLQWADSALLDFIEYLLDWSRTHPLFVITLARPELSDRRPGWGGGRRNVTMLSLEPLSHEAMDELLEGLVPGLPEATRRLIRDRAEGMPLYAVETVRMLLDRGVLRREGDRYVPVSAVDELEVPETLHALIAARLDILSADERALLQDASVLGKSFTRAALSAVTGRTEHDLEPLLAGLVRKELLGVQADPRAPQRAEYGFLQALVQKVAHDTLSRRDRRARHLAVADYLQRAWGSEEGEIVEVVASHYVDAYLADPDAPDAGDIRRRAGECLGRAGERAESMAAHEDAHRYFQRAAEMSGDLGERATLLLRAGKAATVAGHSDPAQVCFEEAREIFDSLGDDHGAALVTAELAHIMWWQRKQLPEAIELLRDAYRVLSQGEPDEVLVRVGAQLARLLYFGGYADDALGVLDATLPIAEAHRMLAFLSEALNTKSLVLGSHHRLEEAQALILHALKLGLESGDGATALRAHVNLSSMMQGRDEYEGGLAVARQGLALARKLGHRHFEWFLLGHLTQHCFWLGRWEELEAAVAELPDWRAEPDARTERGLAASMQVAVACWRGSVDEAEPLLELFELGAEGSDADVQKRAASLTTWAWFEAARGNHPKALVLATRAVEECEAALGIGHPYVKPAYVALLDAALACDELAAAEAVLVRLETSPPGLVPPYLRAEAARFRARIESRAGRDAGVEDLLRAAERQLAELGLVLALAEVRVELAEWLTAHGRIEEAGPAAAAARETFERLRATRWLTRLSALVPEAQTVPA